MKLKEGKTPKRWVKIPKGKPPRPLPKDIKLIWNNNPGNGNRFLGAKWLGYSGGAPAYFGFWIQSAAPLSKRKITKSFWKSFSHEYFNSKEPLQ